MSDEPEEQDPPDEYDPDDYPDHDDNVVFKFDWIAAGILFFRVRPIEGEKEFEHCPEVSAAFVMKVAAIDISCFEFDVVWLSISKKSTIGNAQRNRVRSLGRREEEKRQCSMPQMSAGPRSGSTWN